ncbi:hypothetical protein LUZ60_014885 [Juncus effusus]|nr:hypothetical protein LUZ60_014885 [Juncus effusus]
MAVSLILLPLLLLSISSLSTGDPQTKLLDLACSQYNATSKSAFFSSLNSSIADINASISLSNFSNFATSSQPRATPPIYALLQCRLYLSVHDCASCFSAAVTLLRSCGAANGARAIFDGCMLRYESAKFFDQGTQLGNTQICGNGSQLNEGLSTETTGLVSDLAKAVPKTAKFFAAVERDGLYGTAQCVETLTKSTCAQCLQVAVTNIDGCLPEPNGRAIDAGCFMRYSNDAFFTNNQTIDITPFLSSGKSSKKYAIIGGVVGGAVFVLVIMCLGLLLLTRKSRRPQRTRRGDISMVTELQGALKFRYNDLKTATNYFSEQNKLGEGGFGDVYKGLLKNGTIVAVKRLAITETSRAKADYKSEVKLISNVHHRNLVRLLGYSSKGDDLLLVYEFMANTSLDKFIFGEHRGTLNWKQRYDIIVGMARGLSYLHHEFYVCIIHRDIKSSNILLDDDFQPKIADFGLARLLPDDLSHLSTKFAGTLGYTAPEYAIHGNLSEKVDTYSYGVVVLEIISGRKSNDTKLELTNQYLLEWAWRLYEANELLSLVDESLNPDEYDANEVKRTIEMALMCTQSTVSARPTMSEVVVMLLSKVGPIVQPTRPTFIDSTSRVRGENSSSSSSSASKATVSISQISAR